MSGTVYFDLEGESADRLYSSAPHSGYVRLCGAAVDGSEVRVTPDPRRLLALLERAERIVAHNGFGYDLPALARHCGADYDALARKTVCTYVVAKTLDPPSSRGVAPWGVKGYYGLDAFAGRLGVTGKITGEDSLRSLALEFGPEEGSEEDRVKAGFGRIPVDDPR